MRIAIWTEKGGQGKTSLALAIALEYDFPVITNDLKSPIDKVLPDGDAYHLATNEDFPEVPVGNKIIFDLGGKAEDRVTTALYNSDIVIIPVIYNAPQEMTGLLESISEAQRHNNNIIIVVNGSKRGKFQTTAEIIRGHFPDYPILEVKETRAFAWIVDLGLPLSKIIEGEPLGERYFREAYRQLAHLMTVIEFEAGNSAKVALA